MLYLRLTHRDPLLTHCSPSRADIYTFTQTHFTACNKQTVYKNKQFRWWICTAGARWAFKCPWCGKDEANERGSEYVPAWDRSRNGFCKALAVGINAGCRVKGVFRGKRTNTWWRFTEELFRRASKAPLNSTSALQPHLTKLLHNNTNVSNRKLFPFITWAWLRSISEGKCLAVLL